MDLDRVKDALDEKTPQLVKDNTGAMVGALVGLLFTNSEKAKSVLLGAVAGALLIDKRNKDDE